MRKPNFLLFLLFSLLLIALPLSSFSATMRGIRVTAGKTQDLYLYKDYYALVVGISDYQNWPDLPSADNDAKEVAARLKAFGFEVKLVLDPSAEQLRQALSDVVYEKGGETNRALLFYFAGHGETLELADGTQLGYIVPSDCPLKNIDPMGFDSKAISMKDVEVLALKVKSKHFIMLFDSCFSGSLFNVVRSAPVDISEKSALPVRQFITAGGAGEQVPDQSVFKVVFLRGINGDVDLNGDGYVTGSELGMYL
ncbi:MAG: caspase family protein, partial [Desulfobacterales bacterium]